MPTTAVGTGGLIVVTGQGLCLWKKFPLKLLLVVVVVRPDVRLLGVDRRTTGTASVAVAVAVVTVTDCCAAVFKDDDDNDDIAPGLRRAARSLLLLLVVVVIFETLRDWNTTLCSLSLVGVVVVPIALYHTRSLAHSLTQSNVQTVVVVIFMVCFVRFLCWSNRSSSVRLDTVHIILQ